MIKVKQRFGNLSHRKSARLAFLSVLIMHFIYVANVMAIPGDLPGGVFQDILLPESLNSVNGIYDYIFTGYGKTELIMRRWRNRKMHSSIIRMNTACEKILAVRGDTVIYRMSTIKKALGEAYEEKGGYRTAVRCYKQLTLLYDIFNKRERQSAAMVPAAAYGIHEKGPSVRHRVSASRAGRICLILTGCIAFLSGIILGFTVFYNRKMRVKNEALIENIKELLRYKDELRRKQEENRMLREQIRRLREKAGPAPEKDFKQTGTEKMENAAKDMAGETARGEMTVNIVPKKKIDEEIYNKALFERVDHLIQSKQLYLDPDFSRDKLAAYIYIPRNRFAPFIKQYTGTSFSKYLNNFRLEFAARSLLENPHYSIGAIAKDCGIPASTTFYTLFVEKFKVTPSNFRNINKSSDN